METITQDVHAHGSTTVPLKRRPEWIWRRLLFPWILALSGLPLHASHMSGGEITWTCAGAGVYTVKLTIYRDCAGAPMLSTVPLHFSGETVSFDLILNADPGQEISQLCPSQLPNSTCNGGALPGMQKYSYSSTVQLGPLGQMIWNITFTEIFRNDAIVNLDTPGMRANHLYASINTALAPCNDSPQFTNTPIPYVCLGQPVDFSYGVFDPDADSLSYELIGAKGVNGVPLSYLFPHTATEPIPGLVLDPLTGEVSFTPTVQGNWVVVVLVKEYNALGQVIGSVIRDMQFIVYPCSNTQPDGATGLIAGLTGAAGLVGPRAIELCPGGDFCFSMTISDPDAGDILTATSNIQQNLPGATFSSSGTNPITCTVCWDAQNNFTGVFPFIVTVSDNACPIPGLQTYVYAVSVVEWLQVLFSVQDESCPGVGDGTATATAWAGALPYTYVWSTGASGPTITAGAGQYTVAVTDANGCASATTEVSIGTAVPATANAGPDLTICAGNVPLVLSGSVLGADSGSWSGGAGTFSGSWPNIQYTPAANEWNAGPIPFTLNAAGSSLCTSSMDEVLITFSNAFAGMQVITTPVTCFGGSDGSTAIVPADPTLDYSWNDPTAQTTSAATGLGAGTWEVSVSDAFGCSAVFGATITEPLALELLGMQVTNETCAGIGSGSITPNVTGGTPPYTFTWNTGDESPTLVAGAGSYSVVITDASACSAINALATILSTGLPNGADAGDDGIVCLADLPIALQGSVINAPTATWSGGLGNFTGAGASGYYQPTAEEIQAGSVSLVLTTVGNASCPPASDTVQFVLAPGFIGVEAIVTDASCGGVLDGAAEVHPALGSYTYQWNDPAAQTTSAITGMPPGAWSVIVSDALGCDTTLTCVIGSPTVLDLELTTTDVVCNGQNTGTATVAVSGGIPGYLITWSDGSSGGSIDDLQVGPISVQVTDANGCASTASAAISEPAAITVAMQVPDTVCVDTPVLLDAQASGGSGALSYSWTGLGSGASLTTSFGGSQAVQLTVTDTAGCTGPLLSEFVHVLDLSSALLSTSGDTTICAGDTVQVGAWVSGYAGSLTYAWPDLGYTGQGSHAVPLTTDDTLSVMVTDGCGNDLSATIIVQVDVPPTMAIGPVIAENCGPFLAQFPDLDLDPGYTCVWDLGNGSTTTDPSPEVFYTEGSYPVSLTITTPLGCTSSVPMTGMVHAWPLPVAQFTADRWLAYTDDPVIQFTDLSTDSIVAWSWSFGDGTDSGVQDPATEYTGPGTYAVELWVRDVHGCIDTTQRSITIEIAHRISIPTAFTPDPNASNGGAWIPGDLSNDVFYPLMEYVKEFQMLIYDRWGELIHVSADPAIGWDGYDKGQLSPQDVYIYRITVRFDDEKVLVRTGDVTLLR